MVRVDSLTRTWRNEDATHDEVVARLVAQGWQVTHDDVGGVKELHHPDMPGERRIVWPDGEE